MVSERERQTPNMSGPDEGDGGLNKYTRGERIGSGAYKVVYRAISHEDGREVAWNELKIPTSAEKEYRKKILQEVELLQTLNHDNIIGIYDSWEDEKNKEVVFITELMTSGTLKEYLARVGKVKLKTIKDWCRQILRGLEYLHTHDPPIIHRDIKCDNIFMNGSRGELKIGDLGLSYVMKDRPFAASVIGTPEFMAPELYNEKYTSKVDIYAFGMCVLEMITGQYPFSELTTQAAVLRAVMDGIKPRSLEYIEFPDLRQFVDLCLLPEEERSSASELLMHPFLTEEKEDNRLITVGNRLPPRVSSSEFRQGGPPTITTRLSSEGGSDSLAQEEDQRVGATATVIGQEGPNLQIQLQLRTGTHEHSVKFTFSLLTDTSTQVAQEMQQELSFSKDLQACIIKNLDSIVEAAREPELAEDTVGGEGRHLSGERRVVGMSYFALAENLDQRQEKNPLVFVGASPEQVLQQVDLATGDSGHSLLREADHLGRIAFSNPLLLEGHLEDGSDVSEKAIHALSSSLDGQEFSSFVVSQAVDLLHGAVDVEETNEGEGASSARDSQGSTDMSRYAQAHAPEEKGIASNGSSDVGRALGTTGEDGQCWLRESGGSEELYHASGRDHAAEEASINIIGRSRSFSPPSNSVSSLEDAESRDEAVASSDSNLMSVSGGSFERNFDPRESAHTYSAAVIMGSVPPGEAQLRGDSDQDPRGSPEQGVAQCLVVESEDSDLMDDQHDNDNPRSGAGTSESFIGGSSSLYPVNPFGFQVAGEGWENGVDMMAPSSPGGISSGSSTSVKSHPSRLHHSSSTISVHSGSPRTSKSLSSMDGGGSLGLTYPLTGEDSYMDNQPPIVTPDNSSRSPIPSRTEKEKNSGVGGVLPSDSESFLQDSDGVETVEARRLTDSDPISEGKLSITTNEGSTRSTCHASRPLNITISSSFVPMVVCNPEGTITQCSASIEPLFGHEVEYLVGKPLRVLFPASGEGSERPDILQSLLSEGGYEALDEEFAVQCLHRNGSKFSARILMLGSEDGCPVFLIKACADRKLKNPGGLYSPLDSLALLPEQAVPSSTNGRKGTNTNRRSNRIPSSEDIRLVKRTSKSGSGVEPESVSRDSRRRAESKKVKLPKDDTWEDLMTRQEERRCQFEGEVTKQRLEMEILFTREKEAFKRREEKESQPQVPKARRAGELNRRNGEPHSSGGGSRRSTPQPSQNVEGPLEPQEQAGTGGSRRSSSNSTSGDASTTSGKRSSSTSWKPIHSDSSPTDSSFGEGDAMGGARSDRGGGGAMEEMFEAPAKPRSRSSRRKGASSRSGRQPSATEETSGMSDDKSTVEDGTEEGPDRRSRRSDMLSKSRSTRENTRSPSRSGASSQKYKHTDTSGQKISILLEEMLSQITQQQKGDGFPAMADSSREELVERMTSLVKELQGGKKEPDLSSGASTGGSQNGRSGPGSEGADIPEASRHANGQPRPSNGSHLPRSTSPGLTTAVEERENSTLGHRSPGLNVPPKSGLGSPPNSGRFASGKGASELQCGEEDKSAEIHKRSLEELDSFMTNKKGL